MNVMSVYTPPFYSQKKQVIKPQIPDVNPVFPLRSIITAMKWESTTQPGVYF